MALKGTLKTNSYNGRYYELSWTATQSITGNSSNVAWTLTAIGGEANWYAERTCILTINGVDVFSKTNRVEREAGIISFGNLTINHNADGTKNFSASIQVAVYTDKINCTASGRWALDTIARQATITAAPDFTDEDNPTITYSNIAGNTVQSLQACISLDGSSPNIAYRDIDKTGTTYTFNLTEAERNVLRNATTNANSRTVKFYIKTVIEGVTYYHNVSKTLTIVNAMPVVSATVKDTNSTTVALTGDNNTLVRYYSNAEYAVIATAQKGASITSYQSKGGGKVSSTSSGTFTGVENGNFSFTVSDSRGNDTGVSITKSIVNYVKLTCDLTVSTPTTGGAMTMKVSGNYFNGSFGKTSNTLTVQYRYKTNGGSFGSWQTLTATKSGNTYSATTSLSGLDYKAQYTFEARATDKLATVSSADMAVKTTPVFDWSADDFNFNVPVHFAEGATGIGDYGEWTPYLNLIFVESYTNQSGWYQKNGNVVSVGFYIKATCKSGYEMGGIEVYGLPFAPSVAASGGGMCSGAYVSAGFNFQCWVAGTNSIITARVQACNNTSADNLATSASGLFCRKGGGEITLSGTITYITA